MPGSPGGHIQAALQAPLAEQKLTIGTEVKSSAFNARTKYVRLHTDAICSILFGTAPTASAANARMAANATEYFGVPMGAAYKVSVITNT